MKKEGVEPETDVTITFKYVTSALHGQDDAVLPSCDAAIFGGSGFLGSCLANWLSDSYKVKILDINPPSNQVQKGAHFELCDIRKYDDVKRGLKDAEIIINCAVVQIPKINEENRLGYEVNIVGTQNLCEVAYKSKSVKAVLLAGSWHVLGESGFRDIVEEASFLRPDKTGNATRYYVLCKIAQETIMRVYDEMSTKFYGTLRLGTVLGESMPGGTAASIFISRGIEGEPITPYSHTMHRPMLYIDVNDVCRAFEASVKKILQNEMPKEDGSLARIVNVVWPEPITIIELANLVRTTIIRLTDGRTSPPVKIVETGQRDMFAENDKNRPRANIRKLESFLGIRELRNPEQSIERIIRARMGNRPDA